MLKDYECLDELEEFIETMQRKNKVIEFMYISKELQEEIEEFVPSPKGEAHLFYGDIQLIVHPHFKKGHFMARIKQGEER